MAKACPKCGLMSPPEVPRCNCGYQFETNDPAQDHSASQRQYKGVRGWLLLFCLALIIYNPIATVVSLARNYNINAREFDQFPNLRILTAIDVVLALGVMAVGVYVGVALWRVRPRAVETAKKYILWSLAYSVIAAIFPFMVGFPSEENPAMLKRAIKDVLGSAVGAAIYYSYLHKSKRVKATYTLQGSESETHLR